jgi:hypothetical protein
MRVKRVVTGECRTGEEMDAQGIKHQSLAKGVAYSEGEGTLCVTG